MSVMDDIEAAAYQRGLAAGRTSCDEEGTLALQEQVKVAWRVGSKVPLNVYDGERSVCQCHSAEDAALIVKAVNQILDRELF